MPSKSLSSHYATWWRSLTPQDRRLLVDKGLFNPEDLTGRKRFDRSRVNDGHWDFSRAEDENNEAVITGNSAVQDVIAKEDDIVAQLDDRLGQLDMASFRLRAVLEFLLDGLDCSTDPAMRLRADVIRIVVGEGRPPRMSDLAKTHGITRAAVSLQCRKLLRRLGLPPSRFMRPDEHVLSMRLSSIVRSLGIGGEDDAKQAKNPAKAPFSRPTPPPTPGKESISNPRKSGSRSRPRENLTQKRSFSKRGGKS